MQQQHHHGVSTKKQRHTHPAVAGSSQGLGGLRMTVDDGAGRQAGAGGGPGSVLVHPDDAVRRLKVSQQRPWVLLRALFGAVHWRACCGAGTVSWGEAAALSCACRSALAWVPCATITITIQSSACADGAARTPGSLPPAAAQGPCISLCALQLPRSPAGRMRQAVCIHVHGCACLAWLCMQRPHIAAWP